jgi:uncharacterized cupin superfamily protein
MTTVIPIDPAPGLAPRPGQSAQDRLISRAPPSLTREFDSSSAAPGWTGIRSGAWVAAPGETRPIRGATPEFRHIPSSRVELEPDSGEVRSLGPGCGFAMKPGFRGIWRRLETVRKVWVAAA